MSVGGMERSFLLYDPPGARALVIALHPLNWTAADFASYIGFDRLAAADGFRVVYPQGLSNAWNAGYCCPAFHPAAVDDTAFLQQLMVSQRNPGWKVFLLGFSNGAMLAFHMACVDPHDITALGTIGSDGEQCAVDPPLPAVLHFQGTADTLTGNRLWQDTPGGWVNTGRRATDWWRDLGASVRLVSVPGKGHDWYRHDPDASAEMAEFFRKRA